MTRPEIVHFLKEKIADAFISEIEFLGETTLEVNKEKLKEILFLLKETYPVLMDLTGVDYLHPERRTKIVYLLHNPQNLQRIRVVSYTRRDEPVPSVVNLWNGADWYERELYDLFGVKFEGHPELKRILMPDDWEGHPLRKDYALTEEKVEFKHDRFPKVPSRIIQIRRSEKLLPP